MGVLGYAVLSFVSSNLASSISEGEGGEERGLCPSLTLLLTLQQPFPGRGSFEKLLAAMHVTLQAPLQEGSVADAVGVYASRLKFALRAIL